MFVKIRRYCLTVNASGETVTPHHLMLAKSEKSCELLDDRGELMVELITAVHSTEIPLKYVRRRSPAV